MVLIDNTVNLGSDVVISDSAQVWGLTQICDGVTIGERAKIGRNVYLGSGVTVGDECKIQNFTLIYEPATLERGVFVGPGVVFTNDRFPRAVTPDFKQKGVDDWEPVGVYVKEGASIGASSVCVAPLIIGRWAMIAAGSVVTKDVPDFALVVGVPARQVGWVGRTGKQLKIDELDKNIFVCPSTGVKYEQHLKNSLIELI